ncbi:hypothetical protein COU20_00140 [Candidatus Kaiserbacteria bacterium CG10_big_fil_rev_8_21_14_0_10_59_10]|uniref:Uncharacterized protein n=1 Tax=Candidatus Kaiserbacteria bacterium CG10_big_fil_rev_8_21_14_0_10_59_10 TaxID=1974612 RepID=A0A2H0U8T6_9BACT|nr:MAG: hypothetical protein COU20_00140 [Candidatus Kaiserbacteria bacterium CG10_big_fil_rev_8_21_14_0_10_59_10]
MNKALRIIVLLIIAALLSFLALFLARVVIETRGGGDFTGPVQSFEECVAAGNPVMESYPRQCRSADGQLFVEDVPPVQDPRVGGGTFGGCAIAGCSGQLCVSADMASEIITTCEWRPEYACYQGATCEMQENGECGWTQTPALQQCLANPPQDI